MKDAFHRAIVTLPLILFCASVQAGEPARSKLTHQRIVIPDVDCGSSVDSRLASEQRSGKTALRAQTRSGSGDCATGGTPRPSSAGSGVRVVDAEVLGHPGGKVTYGPIEWKIITCAELYLGVGRGSPASRSNPGQPDGKVYRMDRGGKTYIGFTEAGWFNGLMMARGGGPEGYGGARMTRQAVYVDGKFSHYTPWDGPTEVGLCDWNIERAGSSFVIEPD